MHSCESGHEVNLVMNLCNMQPLASDAAIVERKKYMWGRESLKCVCICLCVCMYVFVLRGYYW